MFLRESASVLVAQIVTFALGFASSVVVARVLGPAGKGQLALIMTFVSIMALVGNLGLGPALIYFLNRDPNERARLIHAGFVLQAGVMLVLMLIMLGCSRYAATTLFRDQVDTGVVLVGMVLLFPVTSLTAVISNVYVGLLRFNAYGRLQAGSAALQLAALLALSSYVPLSVRSVLAVYALAPLPAVIVAMYWLRQNGVAMRPSIDVRLSKRLLGYGGKAWVGNIIQYFNYRLDVYFVNFFWGASAVGFYSIAVSLAELIWYIPHAVATVLFPRTAADWERAKDFTPRVSRNIAAITVAAAAMLAIGGPSLLTATYGERFRPAVAPLLTLLPGIVFLSVGKVLSSDLAGRNRPEYGMWASLTSLGLTVVLDIVLIPPLGVTGAGTASSVAYAVTSIILLGWYVKLSGNGPVSVLVMQKSDLQMYSAVAGKICRRVRGESPA